MPIRILCPSCQRKGSLPDNFPGGRVKCPGCGVVSNIPAPGAAPSPSQRLAFERFDDEDVPLPAPPPRSRPAAAPPRPVAPAPPAYDDLDEEDDAEEMPMPPPRPAFAGRSARPAAAPSGSNSGLIIGLAVGGGVLGFVAVVGIVFAVTMSSKPTPVVQDDAPAVALQPQPMPRPGPPTQPTSSVSGRLPGPPTGQVRGVYDPVKGEIVSRNPSAGTATASATADTGPESPDQMVKRLKDLTVFIKIKEKDGESSGTGFVIEANGSDVLVATNNHVVNPPIERGGDDEPTKAPAGPPPAPIVVFRSGEGAGREQSLPGTVLANDVDRDLALVTVKGVKDAPRPLDLSRKAELIERRNVTAFGFPFGRMLDRRRSNPAITITDGKISSLRRNERGDIDKVQVDVSIDPGNSGGPIVDEQGRLVGVAVAKVRESNIGFAVPPNDLDRVLAGKVGHPQLDLKSIQGTTAVLSLKLDLIDPKEQIQTVAATFKAVPGKQEPPPPSDPSAFQPIPGGQSVELSLDRARRLAECTFQVNLAGENDRRVFLQWKYAYRSGSGGGNVNIGAFDVPTSPGPIGRSGIDPKLAGLLKKAVESYKQLGKLVDRLKDCKIEKSPKEIKITIPGGTAVHMNSDYPNAKFKTAPMALMDVKGDFLAAVKIPGKIRPGPEPAKKKVKFSYQGAGLVLWQDERNYVILERGVRVAPNGATQSHILSLEICKDGKPIGDDIHIDIPDQDTYLMIYRDEGDINCMFSFDMHNWVAFQTLAVEYPDRFKLGISATNTSKKPFTPRFTEFLVFQKPDDKDKGSKDKGDDKDE